MSKSMVLDLGWFNGNRMKFENQQKQIQLFLKSSRVIMINNRIIIILACIREGIAGIYTQKKLDQIEDKKDIQDQKEFVREIKTMFSDKSKIADTKQKIKMFKQEKKHIADFIIKFEALAIKAETDNMYAIFLLKKNIWTDIIKKILEYLPMVALETLREQKVAITSVGQEYEFIESQHDYKTGTRTIYEGRGTSIDIGKTKDNFNKDRRLKCFNCNTYRYMAKECRKLEERTRHKEML